MLDMRRRHSYALRTAAEWRTFVLHALAFWLPATNLMFWLTGPHAANRACWWTLPVLALTCIDRFAPAARAQPEPDLPGRLYDAQLIGLFGMQMFCHSMLLLRASQLHLNDAASAHQTASMLGTALVLSGTTGACTGLATAHEFIHRPGRLWPALGHILLVSALYDHYATEHIRGHHVRVGTPEDPVTAHFGETHWHFIWRTIPQQFRSAWRIEARRLDQKGVTAPGARLLGHRVLQGVAVELALLCAIGFGLGPVALLFFVAQALMAIVLLETVNYIEHWGLSRSGKKVRTVDSWDTDSFVTLYTIVGLSRHADHHVLASRPYQQLRHHEETAKLHCGYYAAITDAMLWNWYFRERATAELQRKQLGPFQAPKFAGD